MKTDVPPVQLAIPLLLVSGFAALIYQTVWMTSFRLIFGASTLSTGAVLAIFMGGLGLGGWYWGRRLDRNPHPLRVYGHLEIVIALFAAASPFVIEAVRWLYAVSGGHSTFGPYVGTGIRLLLAILVMGIPVFCMGGTLPAMARFVTDQKDSQRQGLAILYGVNTLGSVAGALAGTFYFFEAIGLQKTLWFAAVLNICIALIALRASLGFAARSTTPTPSADLGRVIESRTPPYLIGVAAFVSGFLFFVAELVWFRMSSPIFGGTTYSFGLVLAVALVGIGLGALFYRFVDGALITEKLLVFTFLLEALVLVIPYGFGDSVALWAYQLRILGGDNFFHLCLGWGLIAGVMVFPAALVAGFQFPVLVAIRGRGPQGIALQVGELYMANTAGAVAGSLAGGFGLMPLLGALGAWLLTVFLALAMGLWFYIYLRDDRRRMLLWTAPMTVLVIGFMVISEGPTAVWRHSGIGAGRGKLNLDSKNTLKEAIHYNRRKIGDEFDGVESPIGIETEGLSLLINGKSDGNIWLDAMTTTMLGLTGAILHPNPENAFVIGLGGGQTVGWLAEVSSINQVDVVELEEKVAHFAQIAKASNFDVMNHPKVNIINDDGRAALMASNTKYDLIISEPSNPYRAGVASFFTDDFYAKVNQQLNEGGYLAQWVQGYEIDWATLKLILSTLRNNFDHVAVWSLQPMDFLLLASNHPQKYEASFLRERINKAPFKKALKNICGIFDAESFLALHQANPLYAEQVTLPPHHIINTDDQNLLEYQFAKSLGTRRKITPKEIYFSAQKMRAHRPAVNGEIDWKRVTALKNRTNHLFNAEPEFSYQQDWWELAKKEKFAAAVQWLRNSPPAPKYDYFERVQRFEFLLYLGEQIEELSPEHPQYHVDLDPWLSVANHKKFFGTLRRSGQAQEAVWLELAATVLQEDEARLISVAEKAFAALRENPWIRRGLVERVLQNMSAIKWSPNVASQMATLLARTPFPFQGWQKLRTDIAQQLAEKGEDWSLCAKLYEANDHAPQWEAEHLQRRLKCYQKVGHAHTPHAEQDLIDFLAP